LDSGRSMDRSDILHAIREASQENNSSKEIESVSMTRLYEHQVGRGVAREERFSEKPKKNSEPTQNWCCQSFYAEGYTKKEI
jgi:hypothetical protein